MSLTHKEARRILEMLDHTRHLDFLEVRIGDTTLTASKSGTVQRSLEPAQGARRQHRRSRRQQLWWSQANPKSPKVRWPYARP